MTTTVCDYEKKMGVCDLPECIAIRNSFKIELTSFEKEGEVSWLFPLLGQNFTSLKLFPVLTPLIYSFLSLILWCI